MRYILIAMLLMSFQTLASKEANNFSCIDKLVSGLDKKKDGEFTRYSLVKVNPDLKTIYYRVDLLPTDYEGFVRDPARELVGAGYELEEFYNFLGFKGVKKQVLTSESNVFVYYMLESEGVYIVIFSTSQEEVMRRLSLCNL